VLASFERVIEGYGLSSHLISRKFFQTAMEWTHFRKK
jgi:hypothetical protein